MSKPLVGIIGGTGIGERFAEYPGTSLHVPTESGMLRGRVIEYRGTSVVLVQRHAAGHAVPPHKVNYAAVARGMKQLGAVACFSTAAVGSLRAEWRPGHLVVCSDFLDFTGRNPTLFDATVVHRDFTTPFGATSRNALLAAAAEIGAKVEDGGVYLSDNGPRYETPREIEMYRSLGADLVGMTATTEAILMREAMVEYACLAIVTNLASGMSDQPLNHLEVVDQMRRSGEQAVEILLGAAARICGAV